LVKGAILLEHAQPGTLTADVLDSAKNLARALSLELELIELHDLSKVPLMPTPPASEVSFKHLPAVPSEVAIFVGEGSPLIDWKTSQMIKTIATAQSNNAAVVTSTLTKTLTDCLSSSSPGYIAPWVVLLATNTLAKDSSATALSTLVPLMERNFLALAKAPDLEAAAKARLHDSLVAPFSDMHALAEARQCLTKVQELGFCPSSKAYASIIARLDENASTDTASEALTLFNDAIARGVRPDTYLYNTVIAKLAKARRFDEALQLFQDLKASGLTPNGVTYGTIINACCRVGNTELAESLFEEMELDPRVSSRIAPYNTLMQHFVRVRADRTQALHYWHRLLAQNLAPSAHSYRLLIEAYGHLDPVDPDGVKRVLSMMRAKRMPILPVHHAAVIGMYGKSGDLRTAQSYFGKLDQLPNYARDPVLHQALLEACVHNKDQAGMVDVIDKMREQGMTLDAYLANVIIEGYANGGSLAEARTFFDSLKEGTGPQHKEPSTYAAMAKAYLAHHCKDEALAIVEQARRQTYPPAVLHKIESLVQE
jgi:pentatricopeptide repeat protein